MSTHSDDTLITIIAFILMLAPFISYYLIVTGQFKKLKVGTSTLQILSTRAVSCVPFYALMIFIIMVRPEAYYGIQIPISLFEGYSFYCFLSLIVNNMGGPNNLIKALRANDKPLCCSFCCPSDSEAFYNRVSWSMFHFLVTRSIIIVVSVIFEKKKAIFIILQFIAFVILANGVLSLLILYENVYNSCVNILGISKLIILKVSVGLIVIQGLIVEAIVALNKVTLKSDSQYSADDRAYRVYCFVVLIEYVIISVAMYVSYSSEILPPPGKNEDPKSFEALQWSFCDYFGRLFMFHDVFGTLSIQQDDIKTPLHADHA